MARGRPSEEKPIDFLWLRFIGVTRLGFTYKTIGFLYFGYWADLFETYKKNYNFETKKGLYRILEMEEVSSLDVL